MNFSLANMLPAVTFVTVLAGLSEALIAGEDATVIELELASSINVSSDVYTLGDVIVAEGSRGWRTKQLHKSILGRSPRPGYIAHLTRTQISARLESLFPDIHRAISWRGSTAVKVRSVAVNLPHERLVETAHSYLEQELAQQFETYSASFVGTIHDLIVPKGDVEIEATLGGRKHVGTRTCVWLDISIAGRHYQTVPLWFEVESIQPVWVLSRDRKENDYLDGSLLQRVERDVAQLPEAPLGLDISLEHTRLTQAVAAGQVLTRSMVEPIPAVEKGELVTVHAQAGRVRLQTKAIAMADGDLAQRIPVQNRNQGASYAAVVVGPGEVAIDAY